MEPWQWGLLLAAALGAGFVDAVVGGGGLIQTPALFSVFPAASGVAPATLFGTNKLSGIFGTTAAAWRYASSVAVPWRAVIPGAIAALIFSVLGAWAVTVLPSEFLRKLLPAVLLVVWLYTLFKKDLGGTHAPRLSRSAEVWVGAGLGALLGFYDGFFGPGTGSFLVFAFVRVFGFDFLRASAASKLINVACNVGALALFIPTGHVMWAVGLAMAVCNVAGSQLGSTMALQKGAGFVRFVFILVVFALILRTGYDAYVR
ncbi:MAG: hypothetical protein RL341_97 [Pseudomonadota bacterium]